MSLHQIRKILNESLYGVEEPKVGFMEFDHSEVPPEDFENVYLTLKDQLNQVSVDTKNMKNKKELKRIVIVTTQDRADDISDMFAYFKMPCVKSIFDPQTPDENAQKNYPEPSDVQNTGRKTY